MSKRHVLIWLYFIIKSRDMAVICFIENTSSYILLIYVFHVPRKIAGAR